MNAERLRLIIGAILADIKEAGQQELLSSLSSTVEQLINPRKEQAAIDQLAGQRTKLNNRLHSSRSNLFSPGWKSVIRELGMTRYLGDGLANEVNQIFERNGSSYGVLRAEIENLRQQLNERVRTLADADAALSALGISVDELPADAAEIVFAIPRQAIHNQVPDLGKELIEFEEIVNPFKELATGTRPPLKLTSIGSSDVTVYSQTSIEICSCFAKVLGWLLLHFKVYLEIQKIVQSMKDHAVPEDLQRQTAEHANQSLESGIAELAERALREYGDKLNEERRNEITGEVQISIKKIVSRLSLGYKIDIQAIRSDDSAPDEAKDAYFNSIAETQKLIESLDAMPNKGQLLLENDSSDTAGDKESPPATA